MKFDDAAQFAMNRRSFLETAALPLAWRAARLFAQHGALPQELVLEHKNLPRDPARTVRDYCLETELSPASAAHVLVALVRHKSPKLGFTLHSRSSRTPANAPSPRDFLYGLEKRKEQIDAGDLPWVAMDYGILYHLTGDARWGELFRDLHL